MRIVLFGATGYTGRLTAQALFRRAGKSASPATLVLAGRDEHRLSALRAELGEGGALGEDGAPGAAVETAVADASDREVARLVGSEDVLVTTVGPFVQLGMPAARAAASIGATYFDSTGEPAFVRRLVDELDADARAHEATLVPAFGYDYVPGNLAAEIALRQSPAATHVRVGYFVAGRGAPSSGTVASGAGMLVDPAFAWRGGRLATDHMASRLVAFDLDGRRRAAVSLGGSEHIWLPRRHPGLTDVEVYLGWFGRRSRSVQMSGIGLRALASLPGGRSLANALTARVLPESRSGPDEAARARARTLVVAEAAAPGRQPPVRVVLEGPDPYDLTAELLAWAALRAAEAPPAPKGVVGPADVFGYDELIRACADIGLVPRSGHPPSG